ncbi:pentapeptide repeat-containing protein [Planktothrix sp. FACHB-1355]|uniref:Pentapeptide repeat-containing protein n=1 Tax=Aerosakkonema funiforme FACHB-1375 TaxID=2949571 RepID=A0A926VHX3_9CYAN|nr:MULTISPECIES: pentapeptide repeat-containing protein [Oscillatoriales]MBD2184005.1 pentapeptide repeat-containing protein [Aerosakkonema funiforme FACHB-1375]MBD3557848.1 pentapeptide repeat-containing protein [Planktothrix sp. FACHB-1355]
MPKNQEKRIIVFIWLGNFLLIWYLISLHFYWLPLQSIDSTELTQKERLELRNPVRTTAVQAIGVLIQFIGGAAVLFTFYFTQKNLKITQKNLKIAEKNLQATQDKQITERFTKAIEQLGSQELSMCLGGIYALERIAEESERDSWPIMEVLAAYVCSKAKYRNKGNNIPAIQAILDIFNRYNKRYRKYEGKYLNLKKVNLSKDLFDGVDFYGLNLSNADFTDANLSKRQFIRTNFMFTNFTKADLSKTKFEEVNFTNANLSGANLEKAEFKEVNFTNANISGANLEKAEFTNVNFQNANFSNANLVGMKLYYDRADFSGANFTDTKIADVDKYTKQIYLTTQICQADFKNTVLNRTDFRGVNLIRADFRGAKLERTDFRNAILDNANFENVIFAGSYLQNVSLRDANLSGANLRGAYFINADFENTNFSEADLANADFTGAKNLTQQQIKAARSWKEAKFDFMVS